MGCHEVAGHAVRGRSREHAAVGGRRGKRLSPEQIRAIAEAGGELHGYLTDREYARAKIAFFWRTQPHILRTIAKREMRLMGEAMRRLLKEEQDAYERAKYGEPISGRTTRGNPKPGDTIVDGKGAPPW